MTATLPSAAAPTGLLGALADLLSAHHADSLLAALLTVLQPHLAVEAPETRAVVHVDLALVTQLHLLLARCAALHLLPAVLGEAAPYLATPTAPEPYAVTDGGLSAREYDVLIGMARGDTNQAIGRNLNINADTVKTHASRLFKKLNARDRAHAVHIGHHLGYLEHPARAVA